jgi:hypothetical protein
MTHRNATLLTLLATALGCAETLSSDTPTEDTAGIGRAAAVDTGEQATLERVLSAGSCGSPPTYAPPDCGSQQWTYYSPHLPVAVGWLAVANTGSSSCTVSISKLELSYSTPSGATVLSNTINGAQQLYDGTISGTTFGTLIATISPTTSYTVAAGAGYYAHPFTEMKKVPTDATKVSLAYSVTVGSGCVVQAGIDTYQKYATPTSSSPYTQNGSNTDFIKEAIKSPWVSTSTSTSISITHHPSPSSLTAKACYNAVALSWAAPSDETPDSSHPYSLFHSTSTFDPASYDPDVPAATAWKTSTSTSSTDSGLTIGTKMYYGIYATGVYSSVTTDLHSAMAYTSVTPSNISWPTLTSGTYTGAGSIMLKWKSATSLQTGCGTFISSYSVRQGEVSSTGVCTVKKTFTDPIDWSGSAEDSNQKSGIGSLTSGKKYCFAVAAKLNTGTTSNYSSTLNVTAP